MNRRLLIAFVALGVGGVAYFLLYWASALLFGFVALRLTGFLALGAAAGVFALADKLGFMPSMYENPTSLFPDDTPQTPPDANTPK